MPSFKRCTSPCLLVLSVFALSLSGADFKIGPDTAVDSLALCAGKTSYLAVWRDTQLKLWRACSVSQTGVSGTEIAVSAANSVAIANETQIQSVCFDGTNFLLVWADNRPGAPGIYARRITPEGAFFSGEILIAPIARNFDLQPQVAFTGIDYLVAWHDDAGTSTPNATQVRYVHLGFDGGPGGVSAVPLAEAGSSQKLFTVTAGPTGETLITLQDNGVTPATTRALRVSSPNVVLTPGTGLAVSQSGFGELGFGALIGAFYINQEYTLLTSFGTRMDSSVFRIRILPADNRVIRSTNPLGDVPQGATTFSEDNLPRTFYNGNGEFFFVRNVFAADDTTHITTKRVRLNGDDRDPNLLVVDSATKGLLNGGVAANIGTQYLVAWMDGRRVPAPAFQTNLYGVFIDGNAEADEGFGAVKAVARAAPTIGIAPLTTQFGTSGSTGTIDSSLWEFGDGTSATNIGPSHKYETAGDYVAIFSLFRRGMASRDFVRIFVDSASKGGGGGPAQTITGAPLQSSPGVNPDLFFSSCSVLLNFANPASDTLRLIGYYDPSKIPFSQTDVPVSLTIGSRTYSFKLDEFGVFNSETGAKPFIRYQMNRFTGIFQITTVFDELQSVVGPFGALNNTVAKPGQAVVLPVALTYNDLSRSENISTLYSANVNKTGTLNYRLGTSGFPTFGYFRVLNVAAKERGKVDARVHQFGINGTMGFGGATPFTKATTGSWRVTLGNYTQAIPVELFRQEKAGYTYTAPKSSKGIVVFNYFFSSGSFQLLFNDLSAEGDNPSGLPVATSPVVTADLVLNMDLDLDNGVKFQSGGYARFTRKKINTKKWSPR